ncbi:MAG: hypothetical protein UY11_C0037G0006 [Candidatus Amesbacteria bacterium GW2011_GWC2_47_8]|uniref:Uncharacterized protein n=1 Tax=Candidatus Amesbacteria bacterium GW2011_GWC2_47_8 TaxID=1618367 RepID=A0A0G1TLY6_9BACT|nr:MAG: hypothetical protein UY11_C0037G0006 [Candidatus Amesbacteria bacterium GW2011_GWC2_47_8]
MRKIGAAILILVLVLIAVSAYFKFFRKTQPAVSRSRSITTGTFSDKTIYQAYGYVTKWFPNSDNLEVKLYLGKTVSLAVGDAAKSYIITRDPKDRTKPTVLIKDMYTSQEWGRAFCEGDVLLIGTKDNVWKKVTNYMQITPNFVNVEDRPCYNLPAK